MNTTAITVGRLELKLTELPLPTVRRLAHLLQDISACNR